MSKVCHFVSVTREDKDQALLAKYLDAVSSAGESAPELDTFALTLTTPQGRLNVYAQIVEFGTTVCGSARDENAGRLMAIAAVKLIASEIQDAQKMSLNFSKMKALLAIEESKRKGAGAATSSTDDFAPRAQADSGADK